VKAPGTSDSARYIQSAQADGTAFGKTYLTTDDIRGLRELSFTVGDKPSTWGTSADAAPPALK
jgi:putative alpha-1,2-mannosidase